MRPGLYQETGSAPIYFWNGVTRRHIPDQASLFAEFGGDAWSHVIQVSAGTFGQVQRRRLVLLALLVLTLFVWRMRR